MVSRKKKEGPSTHRQLADTIIEMLKEGVAPWQKPWSAKNTGVPFNPVSGTVYRGINRIMLSHLGLSDPRWMTFRQAQLNGWRIKAGSRGQAIEFWQWKEKVDLRDGQGRIVVDEKGEAARGEVELARPRVRHFYVFNASQMLTVDGLPLPAYEPPELAWEPIGRAEEMVLATGARIIHDQEDRAYYSLPHDQIHLPPRGSFATAVDYYGTLLHEVGHWTRHPDRLDRSGRLGGVDYAREEMRAEIFAWMITGDLGLDFSPARYVSYLGSWLKDLREDPHEIVRACRDAEKIRSYVLELEARAKAREVVEEKIEVGAGVAARKKLEARPMAENSKTRDLVRNVVGRSRGEALEIMERRLPDLSSQEMTRFANSLVRILARPGLVTEAGDRWTRIAEDVQQTLGSRKVPGEYGDFFGEVARLARKELSRISQDVHKPLERQEVSRHNGLLVLIDCLRRLDCPRLLFGKGVYRCLALVGCGPEDKSCHLSLGGRSIGGYKLAGSGKADRFVVIEGQSREVISVFRHRDHAQDFAAVLGDSSIRLLRFFREEEEGAGLMVSRQVVTNSSADIITVEDSAAMGRWYRENVACRDALNAQLEQTAREFGCREKLEVEYKSSPIPEQLLVKFAKLRNSPGA